jgi:hypothetical protein
MDNQIEILSPDDVISSENAWLMAHNTYTTNEFSEATRNRLTVGRETCDEEWAIHQDNCRVLRVGDSQGWRSGKMTVRIKVMVEFEPEGQIEEAVSELPIDASPLDLLRN